MFLNDKSNCLVMNYNSKSPSKEITGDKKDFLEKLFISDFSSLQNGIGRYDTHSLIVKGWAITIWSGLMYFIVKESVYELFLIQVILLIIFWSFDALYKYYQRLLALRYSEMMDYFEGYKLNTKNGELKVVYSSKNKKDLSLINLREKSTYSKAAERKSLKRCIVLRVVSVIYIYLISASFLLSLFIIPILNHALFFTVLALSIFVLSFGIFNYSLGIDDVIEKYKKWYLIFFYATVVSIGLNLILLGLNTL